MALTMQAISVTIGRERRPGSAEEPYAPLPPDQWRAFRDGIQAALEAIPGDGMETREGRTVWDGREEYCLTLSRLHATATPAQLEALRVRLAELAAQHDQDAICLHLERREVVAGRA